MDFKQIEAFISVAKHKSFSKAADMIFLSQPTISSHISSLEKELKIQLFDRTSKEVNLTPAGNSFYEYAINLINLRNNAITNISSFNSNITGTLNLFASSTPCNSIVPKLLNNFHLSYPEVTFNVKEQGSCTILKNILNHTCEIGIVGTYTKNDKIATYTLIEDELIIISSNKLNLPEELSLDMLLKYPFILRESSSATRKTFEEILDNHASDKKGKLNILCQIDNINALLQLVKEGIGVSIVSKQVYENSLENNSLRMSRIKDITMSRNLYLVVNKNKTLTPVAKTFLNMCKKEFKIEDTPIL